MAAEADVDSAPRLLFTAPWEPLVVRRGDALGFRALTDQFADAVAPDLSNRVRDGRWVTILAWCLARSHEAFHASGGRSLATRTEQRKRYAWLRPLELMWVARTIALADDWRDRSLAGQRRVRPWYEDDNRSTDRFGMTEGQFRAYRQTGIYGGYRVVFRNWPGMTVRGDGWTPGPGPLGLAKWLEEKLGAARGASDVGEVGLSKRSAKLNVGKEHLWWLRRWDNFVQGGKSADIHTLPRQTNDFAPLLEADLLRPLVFGSDKSGRRRLEVAREVGRAVAANHLEVCEHLGKAFSTDHTISLLPRFSRLADAGMETMRLITESLRSDSRVELADVAARPAAQPVCEALKAAAQEWLGGAEMQLPHIETAHRFAKAISSARPIECLRDVLQHHERHGGGLRWFVLRDGRVEPRTPPLAGFSHYRFRLWSVCRLATQCRVLHNMPTALGTDDSAGDDASEATDE